MSKFKGKLAFKGKQAFKQKLARRIMAVVLSGAMVMSNMSAYAAELAPEKETETVSAEVVSEAEETAAADSAKEEADSKADDEKAEAESSAAESSESVTDEAGSKDAAEDTAETKTNTEAVESTMAETETASATDKTSETTVEKETTNTDNEDAAVPYEQGDWENNQRTTKWDFTAVPSDMTSDKTLNSTTPVNGLLNKGTGSAKWSAANKILSIKNTSKVTLANGEVKLAIPLDADTVSVDMSFSLSAKTDVRQIGIGSGTDWLVVSQNPNATDSQKITSEKTYSTEDNGQTLAFATEDDGSKWLYVMVGEIEENASISNTGEAKFLNITIIESKSGGDTPPAEHVDWSTIDAPEIISAVQDTDEDGKLKGSVTVTVKADVNDGHGEKVEVILCDKDGEPIKDSNDKNISKLDSKRNTEENKHTVTFDDKQLTESGVYTFKAVLSRKGEGAEDETKDSKAFADMTDDEKKNVTVDFKLPLAAPTVTAKFKEKDADGKGTITVSWKEVKEADKYKVALSYTDDAHTGTEITVPEATAELSIDVTGLEMDSVVSVTVQALRGEGTADIDKSAESAAKEVNVKEPSTIVKAGTHILDIEKEFAGTANGVKFSTGPVTALGENNSEEKIYTSADGYFKLHYNDNARIDAINKTFDGETKTLAINMQGNLTAAGDKDKDGNEIPFTGLNSFEFTVNEVPAAMTVYWYGAGSGTRDIHILDSEGKAVKDSEGKDLYDSTDGSSTMMVSNFTITEAGKYYMGCKTNGCRIAYVKEAEPAKLDMEKEFAGTANGVKFSTGPVTALGENNSEEKIYTSADGYFKLHYNDNARIDAINKTFDGETKTLAINMQGNLTAAGDKDKDGNEIPFTGLNSFEFTVNEVPAAMTVYWYGAGSGTRDIHILDSEGKAVKDSEGKDLYDSTDGSSTMMVSNFTITEAGKYYMGCKTNGCRIAYINVKEGSSGSSGGETVGRGDWESVAAPEITKVEVSDSKITVTVKGVVSLKGTGADIVELEVYNADDLTLDNPQTLNKKDKDGKLSPNSEANTQPDADGNHLTTLTYTPSSSGTYAFKAVLRRAEEKDADGSIITSGGEKKSGYSETATFKLPLSTPDITTLMNLNAVEKEDGSSTGGITASWGAVTEADYYILYAKNANGETVGTSAKTEGTSAQITGLAIGSTVSVTAVAYRSNASGDPDKSDESAPKTIEITGKEPIAYLFDAADEKALIDEETENLKSALSAGTKLGTKDYFTVMIDSSLSGSAVPKSAGTGTYIEINKYGSTGLTFTVYGTADASFTVASTGTSNQSAFGLVKDGRLVDGGSISGNANDTSKESKIYEKDEETKGTAYLAYGTNTSVIEYKNLPAGTYTFLSPNAELNRGGRIHRAVVYDSEDMPDRGAWDPDPEKIGTPTISNVKYIKGESSIMVTASGYIGYYGADSLKVEMLGSDGEVKASMILASDSKTETKKVTDAEGNEKEVIVSAGDADLGFKFTPKASDDYSFRASLVRNGEEDIKMTDEPAVWTVKDFVLPLATPSVSSMTNKESDKENSGSLEVAFKGVDEADYYVVAALYANKDNEAGLELLKADYFDIEKYQDNEDAEVKLKLGFGVIKAEDGKEDYEVEIEDLPQGSCYITVQAFRNKDSKLNLKAETTIIQRGEDGKAVSTTEWTKQEGAETGVAISETDETTRFAVAAARSKASTPDASKYINGKNDTKWSFAVFGSNTTRSSYSRAAGLNGFDGEYDSTKSVSVPANGYYEEVYAENDKDVTDKKKDLGDLKSVTLWSENGRGKVVPASTDGLAYYYTTINPLENNFTLSAKIHVKSWQYTNGQDGFGMMVSDTVGKDGDDGATWTNAYQLLASKFSYSWCRAVTDKSGNVITPGYVTSAGGNGTTIMRYEMKLGVGWNSKEGATAADVAKIKAGTATAPENFLTDSGTLESSAGDHDNGVGWFTGTYNAIGNGYNTTAIPTSTVGEYKEIDGKKVNPDLLTDFRFQIQKYDNAYVLRYLAVDETAPDAQDAGKKYIGNYEVLGEQVFSDDNNNKLTQVDKKNIYIGFFAARQARIGIDDIQLDVTDAGSGNYDIPTTYIDPSVTISSMEASNSENYDFMLGANFDGTLTIDKEAEDGTKTTVVTGKTITAGTKYTFTTKLSEGKTKFTYYATPNTNYVPGIKQELSNFNRLDNEDAPFEVTYHAFKGDTIYVAPNGAYVDNTPIKNDDGVETGHYVGDCAEHPTNVYDAVRYAKAGDTIILAGGMYHLSTDAYNHEGVAENLLVGKKHDGTPKSYITMKAADDAVDNGTTNNRPILNFEQDTFKNDTAFTIAGNYWRFEGFDVMGSKDGQKGIQLSGSHNVLKNLRTYMNGNTGIQVARYGSDGRADWPSYNTLLNCSSFMNYDAGYEDADGFAAKLTCGDGNKFIGCIAAFNADDGWDLFAKVETGSIGVVTIENCLAFKNGYLFGVEDYYGAGQDLIYRWTDFKKFTKNTSIVSAGNGNGFKMGGDSMSGYHVLRNSIAFGNKTKGIDSNSCPDIQIYNSISFNNESSNVALYTGGAVNTDFNVENLISIKDNSCARGSAKGEQFDLRGTQNKAKVYSSKNYYWNGSKSVNVDGGVYDTSKFGHMSMNTAIFGGADAISRNEDGSINLHGFLEGDDNCFMGSSNEDSLDLGADIYVFAAEYCVSGKTLGDISLNGAGASDAAKDLSAKGYKWVNKEILTAAYAGSAVDFKVTDETNEKTVTVNFIQLDGAELQIISGDDDENGSEGVLDKFETWTVEAVPVISPAVEPDVKLSGFSAEVKETSKDLVKVSNAEAGKVNENLDVKGARVTLNENGSNGDVKMTATVTLTAGGKTVKQTATLAFVVSNGKGIKFDSTTPENGNNVISKPSSDYIQVAMGKVNEFTLNNLHFYKTEKDETGTKETVMEFGKGVKISVNDTSVIKLASTTTSANGVDAKFTVVNKSGDGGTATVTVTSKDDKSLVRNYIVTVSGSDFAWKAGTIEIDKAKIAGKELKMLVPFGRQYSEIAADVPEVDENGKAKKDGYGNVKIKEYGIKAVEVYKGAKVSSNPDSSYNDCFTATQRANGVYELNTTEKAVTGLPKGVYTVVYEAKIFAMNEDGTTKDEPEPVRFTPITIKVAETKPAVTFKQTKKVNLFYNNGTKGSTGTLTAKYKQDTVTVTTTSKNDYFRLTENAEGSYDIVSIDPNGANKKTPVKWENDKADFKLVKQNSKIDLKAHVDGYYDAYDVEKKNFTIGIEYRQPKLKVTTLDKAIYTKIGMDSANIWIYDPTEGYLNPDTAEMTLVTDQAVNKKAFSKANADFIVDGGAAISGSNGEDGAKLKVKDVNDPSLKGGSVKLSVVHSDWFEKDPVIVSVNIKVDTKTVPKLTVKPVKLNINTEDFVGKEQVSAEIVLNGVVGFHINDIALDENAPANNKVKEFWQDYVKCDFVPAEDKDNPEDKNILKVSLKKNKEGKFPAVPDGKGGYKLEPGVASSYSFILKSSLGQIPLKISLVSKEKLTVSTKGSINIIDRETGVVQLKPKMTNFTPLQVANVALTGDAAALFTVTEFDRNTGLATVRAKDTADLKQGSYQVTPVYTFDLGVQGTATMMTDKPIKINAKQSALKITGLKDPLEVKLSKMDEAAQTTGFKVLSPAGAYIIGMTQMSGLDNFTLTYTGDGIQVAIKNRAGLKEGTTYKITAYITVEGGGSNVKKQVITVPVRVIR